MTATNEAVRTVPWPAWRDLVGSPREAVRDFGVAALLAAWVAVIGPFGNDDAGPLELRLPYHLSLSVIVVVCYRPGVRIGIVAGARLGAGRLVSAVLSILVISAPTSFVVSAVAVLFFPQLREILSPIDWYVQLVVLILPIAIAYQIFSGFLSRGSTMAGKAPIRTITDVTAPARPSRLPVDSESILALGAEDHYLRIYTAGGSRLLYLTMSEALNELEGVDGMQVHRSWWIARRAAARIVRRGRGAEFICPTAGWRLSPAPVSLH